MRSWSLDGAQIVFQSGDPARLSVLDLATGRKTEVLRHSQHGVFSARVSPDGRWITFHGRHKPDQTRVFVAPFRGAVAVPESEWIAVTSGEFADDKPRWSPDGSVIYFTSERDSFRCLWAQRLEPATKKPVGQPIEVQPFLRIPGEGERDSGMNVKRVPGRR